MTPLESKRLEALGHSDEQITAIHEYEKAVKQEIARELAHLLIKRVPDFEYTKPPHYIKQQISNSIDELIK